MLAYAWPGNVRELEHAVEYAMISSDTGRIERAFLPGPLRGQIPSVRSLVEAESASGSQPASDSLVHALEAHHWNVTATAADLGISRTTLWRRMKQLDIHKS